MGFPPTLGTYSLGPRCSITPMIGFVGCHGEVGGAVGGALGGLAAETGAVEAAGAVGGPGAAVGAVGLPDMGK